jgi:WD40 repeat protein
MLRKALLLALAGLLVAAAWPPPQPLLRIDPGTHTAPIRSLATDGQVLVTGSTDKTARLWELATGRLLRVLRPPIGPGPEGQIRAVALSGDTVACAGWSEPEGNSIYLFDRSGLLRRRIPGLPNVVNKLAFSPDGSRLVAGLWGSHGLRVFRPSDGALVAQDPDYGGSCYGLAFDGAGRLASTSWDGWVRLYDPALRRLARARLQGGQHPFGVAFSPDGTRLAVGFDDTATVAVLSAGDLSSLDSPPPLTGGNLAQVAWSAEGLLAAGRHSSAGRVPILRFTGQSWQELDTGASDTVMDLQALPGGGLVYATAEPSWGSLARDGRSLVRVAPAGPDFRDAPGALRLSADGCTAAFTYDRGGRRPARFSVVERQVLPGPGEGLGPPETGGATGWKGTDEPRIGDLRLRLEANELAISLARRGDRILLGTAWSVRLFDASGQSLWRVSAPGTAWAVNLGQDLAVAALGDGTLRWYRVRDGAELLALFPHRDGRRWVAWTPSGYYDASCGGEDLVGWNVNRGPDQASDFFPASRFRATFYRPDVVARVLTTLDEARAVKQADLEAGRQPAAGSVAGRLPPVLSIFSPADGAPVSTPQVEVRFSLRSEAPVRDLRALVDGRPARDLGMVPTSPTGTLQVAIPSRDCQVSLVASNDHGTSEPATVHLRWQGAGPAPGPPGLRLLAVGIARYRWPGLRLEFAAKDARDFVQVMTAQKGRLYSQVTAQVLTDEQASRAAITAALQELRRSTGERDVAMVFVSGHGTNMSGRYYFLPVDFEPPRARETSIDASQFVEVVQGVPGKVLLFLDTCHAGNVLSARDRRLASTAAELAPPDPWRNDTNALANELASAENGAVVFTASTGSQVSFEDPLWGNGAFTKALVEGLQGRAAYSPGNPKITVNMLDLYLAERVRELTRDRQTPATAKPRTIPDFPIAVAPSKASP